MYNYLFRILIVGDATVGKTSICNRISNNTFTPYSPATIGVDFNVFNLKLLNDSIIKCQLWDTAGSERFRSITRSYYNNTAVVILVFDLSDAKSFNRLPMWLQEIKDNVRNEKYSILLLGNKSDLPPSEISRTEIMDFVEDNNLSYLETSAKNDTEARFKFSDYISELATTADFTGQSTGVTVTPLDIIAKHRRDEDLCCCRFQ
jgi:Rab family protein|tara:strand:- start:324 stop:935 length:612 start_codon:yes stop_codon:yes gene_type:complete